MNNEDWEYAKNQIDHYLAVKLKCDDYMLTIRVARITKFRLGIVFYVNGEVKGKWFTADCEERRRFARPVQKSIYTAKQKAEYKKMGKRFLKQCDINLNKKITYYQYYWTSFNSLKRHLIKNNANIELMR